MLKVAVPAAGGLIVYIVHRWSDHAVVRFFTKSRAPFPRPGELAAHYSLRRLGFSAIWLGVFLVLFLVGIWITLALFKEGPIWVKGVTLFALPLGVAMALASCLLHGITALWRGLFRPSRRFDSEAGEFRGGSEPTRR